MLIEVLNRLASDTGLDPVQQRNTLVALLNNAAKEMYDRLECNKIYWEATLSVPPNKIVALPSYIGELRGMRGSVSEMTFPLHGISSPRYVRKDWSYKWKNWRDLGENPVMQQPTIVAPLVFTTAAGEPTDIEIIVSGQTNKALRDEEKVTMSAATVVTTKLFGPSIYNIMSLSSNRTADITVSDANGTLLAVLANNQTQTRYKLLDISEAPWSYDTSDNKTLIDVLFKVPLYKFVNDSDSFPASADFDNAWYYMAMYLYYRPMQNRPPDYNTYFPQAITCMNAAKNSGEQYIEKKISFGRNKYYDLTKLPKGYWPGAYTHITNG